MRRLNIALALLLIICSVLSPLAALADDVDTGAPIIEDATPTPTETPVIEDTGAGGVEDAPEIPDMPAIDFKDTGEYYRVSNGVKVYHFGKDGLNEIWSYDEKVLMLDDEQFKLEIGGVVSEAKIAEISYKEVAPYHYEIYQSYDCGDGTIYISDYTVKTGEALTADVTIKSGGKQAYKIIWDFVPTSSYTGITDGVKFRNGLNLQWGDVKQTLGDIATVVSKDTNVDCVKFDIGTLEAGESKELDPVAGGGNTYWVGNGGNWSDGANHWSDSSGGTPNASYVPDSNSPVFFDNLSFNTSGQVVTVDATMYCLDLDFTGSLYTPTVAIGGSVIYYYGNVTTIAAMSITGTTVGGGLTYRGAGANTFRTNGLSLGCNLQESTAATGSLTLLDALTITNIGTNALLWVKGTLDTDGFAVTVSGTIAFAGADAKTITLDTSIVTCAGWNYPGSNLAFSANTATINCSGNFAGGSLDYNGATLNLTGATSTVSGSNTFATLNFINPAAAQAITLTAGTTQTVTGTFTGTGFGTADANRLDILTTSAGSSATINAATVALTKADCKDLIGAGAGSWAMGASSDVRHVSGGSGITYRLYWVADTGNTSDITKWQTTSGGTTNALIVPDSVTNAYFDANSFTAGSKTVTVDAALSVADLDFTGATNTPTLAANSYVSINGSLMTIAAMTWNGGANVVALVGTGNITTNGLTITCDTFVVNGVSYTLQDALTTTTFRLYKGTFDANGKTITTSFTYGTTGADAKTLTLGASIINCAGWSAGGAGVITLTANTATINCSGNAALGNADYNGATLVLTGATSTVSGSPTGLAAFNLTAATTQTISGGGSTLTAGNFSLNGSAGHVHNISNINFTKTGGGSAVYDYLALSSCAGSPASTFYYECNTSIGSGVTGWTSVPKILTLSSGDHGDVTAPGEGAYSYNCSDVVNLVATPDSCYHFVNWTGDTGAIADVNDSTTTVTMGANYSITANFAIDVFTLNYSAGAGGSINGTTPQTVNCSANGSEVTAVPAACYHFVNWSDGGLTAARTDTNVLANISVTANFVINSTTLAVTASPAGGGTPTFNGSSPFNCGDVVNISAGTDPHYAFTGWTPAAGLNDSSLEDAQLTITENTSLTAHYVLVQYTLNTSSSTGGNVTTPATEGAHTYNQSDVISIEATADANYLFVNWTGSTGTIANTSDPTTTITMSGNYTIKANFAIIGNLYPPTGFGAALVSDGCINASWTPGANSSGTIIIMCRDSEWDCDETDFTDLGSDCWVLYNGSGSALDSDYCGIDLDKYSYTLTAYSYNATAFSPLCAAYTLTKDDSMLTMILLIIAVTLATVLLLVGVIKKFRWLTMASAVPWAVTAYFAYMEYRVAGDVLWEVFALFGLVMFVVAGALSMGIGGGDGEDSTGQAAPARSGYLRTRDRLKARLGEDEKEW